MALLFEGSKCSICGLKLMGVGKHYIGMRHCIPGPEHHLWRQSDSGMHWDCWVSWEHRKEFSELAVASELKFEAHNPFRHVIYNTDEVLVDVGDPAGDIDIMEKDYLRSVRVPLADYDAWLAGDEDVGDPSRREVDHIPLMRSLLARIHQEVVSAIPSQEAAREMVVSQYDRIIEKRRWVVESEPGMARHLDSTMLGWRENLLFDCEDPYDA